MHQERSISLVSTQFFTPFNFIPLPDSIAALFRVLVSCGPLKWFERVFCGQVGVMTYRVHFNFWQLLDIFWQILTSEPPAPFGRFPKNHPERNCESSLILAIYGNFKHFLVLETPQLRNFAHIVSQCKFQQVSANPGTFRVFRPYFFLANLTKFWQLSWSFFPFHSTFVHHWNFWHLLAIAKVCFTQWSTSRLALGSPGCRSFVVCRHHAQNILKTL